MKTNFPMVALTILIQVLSACVPTVTPTPDPPTSNCETFNLSVRPQSVQVIPPLQAGDREFGGNGPSVILRLILENKGDHLYARFYMRAEETDSNGKPKNDRSRAEGWYEAPVWYPEAGFRISQIFIPSESSVSYRDTNHDMDVKFPAQGPVAEFRAFGDSSGDDIGSDTTAVAHFRTFQIELEQTLFCD